MLRIRDVYPGSEFFHPGSRVKKASDPGSGSAAKNLSTLMPIKLLLSSYYPGCYPGSGFFPDFCLPGSRGKSTGSRIRIRNTVRINGPALKHSGFLAVFWIHDILVPYRTRYRPGPDPTLFVCGLQDANKNKLFL